MAKPVSPRYVVLDFARDEPFEIGAKMLALLAFPGCAEIDDWRLATEALCSNVIRATSAADPENSAKWRAEYPVYATIDEKESRRRLRKLPTRLRDRMIAARLARLYFGEAIRKGVTVGQRHPGLTVELGDVDSWLATKPEEVVRNSLNELFRFHFPGLSEEARHNREHRIWRKTAPVIHLAEAMDFVGTELGSAPAFGYRLEDLNLHQRVLARAEAYETVLLDEWKRRSPRVKGGSNFVLDPRVLILLRIKK